MSNELILGWRSYLIVESIRKAWKDKRKNFPSNLLVTLHRSCEDSVVLALTNLVAKDSTINIGYLLCTIEAATNTLNKLVEKVGEPTLIKHLPRPNPSEDTFFHQLLRVDRQQVLDFIAQHRQQVADIRSTMTQIRSRRDQKIAHLDKKLLNEFMPTFHEKEVKPIFHQLCSIVQRYYSLLCPHLEPSVFLADIDGGVSEDFERLVALMQEHGSGT